MTAYLLAWLSAAFEAATFAAVAGLVLGPDLFGAGW
jgi:hypothetical protein